MQMKEYVYLQCIQNVYAVDAHLNKNMKSNSNFLNKEIIRFNLRITPKFEN